MLRYLVRPCLPLSEALVLLDRLPDIQRREVSSMHNPQGQVHRIQAFLLVNELLGADGRYCIVHNDDGQPSLYPNEGYNISISHCRTAIAVAVSDSDDVGIDIESVRNVSQSLVERVCSAQERLLISQSVDPQTSFLQLWTRKEAVLKCLGTGIHGFDSLSTALVNLADRHISITDLHHLPPSTFGAIALRAYDGLPSR